MNFEFGTAQRIIFGKGCVDQAHGIVTGYGRRLLLITGKHNQFDSPIINQQSDTKQYEILQIVSDKEPSIGFIQDSLKTIQDFRPEVVVSIGGGSVIDTGKALAILSSNKGEILDYLEVIGKGNPLTKESLPFIAIPTTAGTGSEATRNAVIHDQASGLKVSLRSPFMLPRVAMIDPFLTQGLPPEITASTGMDALTQVIEPLITRKSNPITDSICYYAVSIAREALLTAFHDPGNLEAREQMALVSLFGGIALANSGLGVVHGFAAAIGGMYPGIHHGQICAALLPASFAMNYLASKSKPEYADITHRMEKISWLLAGKSQTKLDVPLRKLISEIGIPDLDKLGIEKMDYPSIVEKALKSSSIKGNPFDLSREELYRILEMS
jgi:alcohol dehydrogenase class IV